MRYFAGLIVFSILLMSCERQMEIDIDVPFKGRKLVVNALNNPDSIWTVNLSLTRHILDDTTYFFRTPENANVTIHDAETDAVIDILTRVDTVGNYAGTVKPETDKTYILKVNTAEFGDAEATCSIPNPVPIERIEMDSSEYSQDIRAIVKMKIFFRDPPQEKNFYRLSLTQVFYYVFNGDTVRNMYPMYFDLDNPSLETRREYEMEWLASDDLFNGDLNVVSIRIRPASCVLVNLSSITESHYRYSTTINLQKDLRGDPFAQPVQVYSNIKNGFGIFGAFNQSVKKIGK